MSRPATIGGRAALVLVAIALVFLVLAVSTCRHEQGAATRAAVASGQAGAAAASGADAVATLGNAQAAEAAIHDTVQEGTHAIDTAPAGDSNNAAARAACQLRSYRDLPRCRALLAAPAR